MIKCSNKECPMRWYHLTCLNLPFAPKGKWLCPHCRRVTNPDKLAAPSTPPPGPARNFPALGEKAKAVKGIITPKSPKKGMAVKKTTPRKKPRQVTRAELKAEEEEKRQRDAEEARVAAFLSTPTKKSGRKGHSKKMVEKEERKVSLEEHVESYKASVGQRSRSKARKGSRRSYFNDEEEEDNVNEVPKAKEYKRNMSIDQ